MKVTFNEQPAGT